MLPREDGFLLVKVCCFGEYDVVVVVPEFLPNLQLRRSRVAHHASLILSGTEWVIVAGQSICNLHCELVRSAGGVVERGSMTSADYVVHTICLIRLAFSVRMCNITQPELPAFFDDTSRVTHKIRHSYRTQSSYVSVISCRQIQMSKIRAFDDIGNI